MAYVCRNYEEAEGTFNMRGAVRSKLWQPNERPLDPKPQTHHKLIKGHNSYGTYYDIKLYQTVMARFYDPEMENDKRVERRLYMGHGSQTSRQFMYHTLGVNLGANTQRDSEGMYSDDSIIMPIYEKHFMQDEGVMFSLDAFYVDGVLAPEYSHHTPHYRLVADKDVRKFKQRVAAHFEPYIMLAQMRMAEFKASCNIDYRYGQAFGGEGFNRAYYMSVQEMWNDPEPRQQDIDVFFEMCQKAYDIIASKRGKDQPDFTMSGSWYSRSKTPSSVDDLAKPIEPNEFRRAILDRIHKYVGSNSMKKPEEVKQFPKQSEYPRSNIQT